MSTRARDKQTRTFGPHSSNTNSLNTYIGRGRIAIQHYMNGEGPIPVKLRAYIREVSEFCPEASFISRDLALHCLTSRYHNTICLYHNVHDRSGKTNDTNPPNSHRLTGVPWTRLLNKKKRVPPKERVVRELGILHCGCEEDDVLWDFFWWKTTVLISPTSGISEPWRFTRLEPRSRGFMVNFIRNLTLLNIDDIYSGVADENKTNVGILRTIEERINPLRRKLEAELQRCSLLKTKPPQRKRV